MVSRPVVTRSIVRTLVVLLALVVAVAACDSGGGDQNEDIGNADAATQDGFSCRLTCSEDGDCAAVAGPCASSATCDESGCCAITLMAAGTACDDACHVNGTCDELGTCTGTTSKVCEEQDGNPCTEALCEPETGDCVERAVDDGTPLHRRCQDGVVCTGGEVDSSGATPSEFAESCTQLDAERDPYGCVAQIRCAEDKEDCFVIHKDDGTQCWASEEDCSGATDHCPSYACQAEECVRDEPAGHGYTCGDPDNENQGEDYPGLCDDEGCRACTELICHWIPSATMPSQKEHYCQPVARVGEECEDGNLCTQNATCRFDDFDESTEGPCGKSTLGRCKGEPKCDSPYPCRHLSCDSETGGCFVEDPDWDNALCEQDNPCYYNAVCVANPEVAPDMLPSGCVATPFPVGTNCEFDGCSVTGLVCADPDGDGILTCTGEAIDCDDDNPCTQDRFECGTDDMGEEFAHCNHIPLVGAMCDDGDTCPGDMCQDGRCVSVCDDGDLCTANACEAGVCQDAVVLPDGSDCSDNDACDGPEVCLEGVCVEQLSGGELSAYLVEFCDDGNPCTSDRCDTVAQMCTHDLQMMNGEPCADGDDNPCTAWTCRSGVCKEEVQFQAGPCDDGCAETFGDHCVEETYQCQGECPDPGPCTIGVFVGFPACCDEEPLNYDDANLCTTDTCDEEGPHHDYACDDGFSCTADYCESPELGCRHDLLEGAECMPGDTDGQECGCCGWQERTCSDLCAWGGWGECHSEGECCPGDPDQVRDCGLCGHQKRSCTSLCQWPESWEVCLDQGVCDPDWPPQTDTCGNCGDRSRICRPDCQWGDWGDCSNEGPCSLGDTDDWPCPYCGERWRDCTDQCEWPSTWQGSCWGVCSPDDDPRGCGTDTGECVAGQETCNDSCQWTGCTAQGPWDEVCDGLDNDCDGSTDHSGCSPATVYIYEDDPNVGCPSTYTSGWSGQLGGPYEQPGSCQHLAAEYRNRTAFARILPTSSCRAGLSRVTFYNGDGCSGETYVFILPNCAETHYINFNCGDFTGRTGADETDAILIEW